MKINVLSRKLIKPRTSTPENLKNYKLSSTDELSPLMNIAAILYYTSHNIKISKSSLDHFEESLSKILPTFYPLAGRDFRKDNLIDCSDQGAEFIQAQVHDVELLDFIDSNNVKSNLQNVNELLPRQCFEVGQTTDPLLSIQITKFNKCGGLALSISVSHRILDASSLWSFIAALAYANNFKKEDRMTTIIPSFDTPKLFPGKNLVNSLNYSATRTPNPEILFKKFLFSNESITNLRATINEPVSRVRIVCALIAKALIGVDKIKQGGKSRTCLIAQAVNIRPRTNPQLPKHLCGNLAMQAVLCINEENKTDHEEIEFQDLVRLLGEATHKTIKDCEEILFSNGGDIFDNSTLSIHDFIAKGDVNCLWFSDWSKFGFYEADFGWGKPVWASVANMYAENLVILMENREGGTGGGIEAFVHLHENYVRHFEQDEGIRSFSY